MAKLLRIVIILLLVLSIVALVLGVKLFGQREVLKGRAQKLADSVIKVASTVEVETPEDWTAHGQQMLDAKITKDQLMAYNRMDDPLKLLTKQATLQFTRLNDTRDKLGETQQTLAKTTQEKDQAQKDLTAANKLAKDQEQKLAAQAEEVKQKTETAAQATALLEEKSKALDDQKADLTKLRDKNQDLEAARKQADDKIKQLLKQLSDLTNPEITHGVVTLPPGLKGRVLIVNKDWNFVVMGVDPNVELAPAVELLVQRDDHFMGKVKISVVKPELGLAVAEVLSDWSQGTIQEGDSVIY